MVEDRSIYDAELDPYRIIWIDPQDVRVVNNLELIPKSHRKYSHIIGGDWDLNTAALDDLYIYETLEMRFTRNKPWEETPYYQKAVERIESGSSYWHNCSSLNELEDRCRKIDDLYEQILRTYQTQKELGRPEAYPNEVAVNIGRNGQFIYENGKHRLCLSGIIGVNQIPVRVVIRHEHWQQIRDSVVNNSLDNFDDRILTHPDIRYLRT